jgi:hypothetical protein
MINPLQMAAKNEKMSMNLGTQHLGNTAKDFLMQSNINIAESNGGTIINPAL